MSKVLGFITLLSPQPNPCTIKKKKKKKFTRVSFVTDSISRRNRAKKKLDIYLLFYYLDFRRILT